MKQLTDRFWADEGGAEMVEWAVVTVVLLISSVPALLLLRDSLTDVFRTVFTELEEDPLDMWAP